MTVSEHGPNPVIACIDAGHVATAGPGVKFEVCKACDTNWPCEYILVAREQASRRAVQMIQPKIMPKPGYGQGFIV